MLITPIYTLSTHDRAPVYTNTNTYNAIASPRLSLVKRSTGHTHTTAEQTTHDHRASNGAILSGEPEVHNVRPVV